MGPVCLCWSTLVLSRSEHSTPMVLDNRSACSVPRPLLPNTAEQPCMSVPAQSDPSAVTAPQGPALFRLHLY